MVASLAQPKRLISVTGAHPLIEGRSRPHVAQSVVSAVPAERNFKILAKRLQFEVARRRECWVLVEEPDRPLYGAKHLKVPREKSIVPLKKGSQEWAIVHCIVGRKTSDVESRASW